MRTGKKQKTGENYGRHNWQCLKHTQSKAKLEANQEKHFYFKHEENRHWATWQVQVCVRWQLCLIHGTED